MDKHAHSTNEMNNTMIRAMHMLYDGTFTRTRRRIERGKEVPPSREYQNCCNLNTFLNGGGFRRAYITIPSMHRTSNGKTVAGVVRNMYLETPASEIVFDCRMLNFDDGTILKTVFGENMEKAMERRFHAILSNYEEDDDDDDNNDMSRVWMSGGSFMIFPLIGVPMNSKPVFPRCYYMANETKFIPVDITERVMLPILHKVLRGTSARDIHNARTSNFIRARNLYKESPPPPPPPPSPSPSVVGQQQQRQRQKLQQRRRKSPGIGLDFSNQSDTDDVDDNNVDNVDNVDVQVDGGNDGTTGLGDDLDCSSSWGSSDGISSVESEPKMTMGHAPPSFDRGKYLMDMVDLDSSSSSANGDDVDATMIVEDSDDFF